MQKIFLSGSELKAIALSSGQGDVRQYLNGVYVEATPEETRLVATDGHRLAAYRRKADNVLDAGFLGFIIPNEAIKQVKANRREPLDRLEIEIEDGRYTFATNWLRISFIPLDGVFPDYRRTIPAQCNGEISQINPEHLADAQKIGNMLKRKPGCIPYLTHNGAGAVRVAIRGLPNFIGVLMPWNVKTIEQTPEPGPALTDETSTRRKAPRDMHSSAKRAA